MKGKTTCTAANSMVGAYADATSPDTPVSIQIQHVKANELFKSNS